MYANHSAIDPNRSVLQVWIIGNKNSDPNKDDEKIQGKYFSDSCSSSAHAQYTALDEGDIQILKTYVWLPDRFTFRSKYTELGPRTVRSGFEKGRERHQGGSETNKRETRYVNPDECASDSRSYTRPQVSKSLIPVWHPQIFGIFQQIASEWPRSTHYKLRDVQKSSRSTPLPLRLRVRLILLVLCKGRGAPTSRISTLSISNRLQNSLWGLGIASHRRISKKG